MYACIERVPFSRFHQRSAVALSPFKCNTNRCTSAAKRSKTGKWKRSPLPALLTTTTTTTIYHRSPHPSTRVVAALRPRFKTCRSAFQCRPVNAVRLRGFLAVVVSRDEWYLSLSSRPVVVPARRHVARGAYAAELRRSAFGSRVAASRRYEFSRMDPRDGRRRT